MGRVLDFGSSYRPTGNVHFAEEGNIFGSKDTKMVEMLDIDKGETAKHSTIAAFCLTLA